MSEMVERVAMALAVRNGNGFESMARAAIEAMREPTQAMRDVRVDDEGCPFYARVYQAMIDEALRD